MHPQYLSSRNKLLVVLFLVGLFLAIIIPQTMAQSVRIDFTVNTTNDTDDINVSDNICADVNGECSLRAAITQANQTVPLDRVLVPAGTYELTLIGEFEDNNAQGDLDILESVEIIGAGSASTIIKGDTAHNNVHIPIPVLTKTIKITGVTIQGNLAKGAVNLLIGAPNCTVYLDGVILTSNKRGLVNLGSTVYVSNSLISFHDNNESVNALSAWGAGIYNRGRMVITNSVIRQNTAIGNSGPPNYYGSGAGIFNESALPVTTYPGDLSLDGVDVLENRAYRDGGGVFNRSASGIVTIANSAIRDNIASGGPTATVYGAGGGVYNNGDDFVTISNTEITDNVADAGGGVRNENTGVIVINDSLIANNGAENTPDGTATGDFAPDNFNPVYGGGGVSNSLNGSKITLERTTISGNSATAGGGIVNYNGGEVIVNNSSITKNFVNTGSVRGARGAGIYNGLSGVAGAAGIGKMTLTNVTISGNEAESINSLTPEGGGIWNRGQMTIRNATIVLNIAGKTVTGSGGGFHQDNAGTQDSVKISNTIIDYNDAFQIGDDCREQINAIESEGNNVIGDANNCATFSIAVLDKLNVDALINQTLQNNGGTTQTHELIVNSPAINAGNTQTCPALDQRGYARVDGICDVGALETGGQFPTPTSTGTITAVPPTATPTRTGTPTFTPSPTRTASNTYTPGGPTVTAEPATATPTGTTQQTSTPGATIQPSSTYTPGGPTITPEPPTSTLDPNTTPTATTDVTGTPGGTGQEILTNGGFEIDVDTDKVPDTWKDSQLSKDKRACDKTDKIVAHSGACAFQFKGLPGENAKITQTVGFDVIDDFVSGDVFVLSVWVEKKNLKDGGKLQAKFAYINPALGNGGKDKIKLEIVKGTGAYEQLVSTPLTLAGPIKQLKVQIAYKGTDGKMNLDDVSLARNGTVSLATATPSPTATSTLTTDITGTPSGDVDVVVNGGFELNADGNKEPDSWAGSNLTDDKHVCNASGSTVAHSGACAFQFKGVTGEASILTHVLDFDVIADFQTGDTFNLLAWVEKQGLKDGAKIQVIFTYINPNAGNGGQDKIVIQVPKGDAAYAQLTGLPLTLATTVSKVKIQISYTGSSGRMFIDDVSLLRTPAQARSGSDLLPLP